MEGTPSGTEPSHKHFRRQPLREERCFLYRIRLMQAARCRVCWITHRVGGRAWRARACRISNAEGKARAVGMSALK